MNREEYRILVITAKILQFCAELFAVFGLIFFAYLYFHTYNDHPLSALHDPFFIVTVLFPFLPAAVMAAMAAKKRKQIRALLEQSSKSS